MKNFFKAVRESIHLAPAIALATLCSIGIALLWGGNITALAPVIEITLRNESIQTYLEKQAASIESDIAAKQALIQDVNLAPLQQSNIQSEVADLQNTLKSKNWQLEWAKTLLPNDPFLTICSIMGVLVCTTLLKHVLMLTSDMLLGYASTSIVRDLRRRIFAKSLQMDKAQHQSVGNSTLLASITSATDGLSAGLLACFGILIREPLRVISCLVLACLISWRLLFLSVVLAPVLVAVIVYFNKKIRSIAASILGRNAGFHEVLLEALNNIFTVQAFTMEPREKVRFDECTRDMQRIGLRMTFYSGLSKPFTELVGVGMVAITVCAGAYLVVNQETHIFFLKIRDTPISVTELLIFFGLLIGASDPLRKLSGVSILIYSGAMAANMIYGILESKPNVQDPESPALLPGRAHALSIENLSFHYNESHPILQNIQLDIPFGRTIALLGHNGSGKSTMIQLLCRYYDPTDGAITLGGVDIRKLALRDLRGRIALVSQSTELFNRTVMENIQYGSPDATEEEVIEAAKLAHAHDFITEALSDGYQTIVGQGGQKLSGGQRQRIALARAILRKPEILILDESTSQIDMASEIQIRETLQTMKGNMTIIIITHREALIALADEVYTLQRGKLESTPHSLQAVA
ncbi:Lipid A export ATP-binding/permease protein MsbA [Pirellula sp. SH-Sr6A]|uniref:ABC transporter ATP-binding protein n=1 Tax=Pirellula sp. SH-Sr6A TaxID=1632865 RepID=UPI00078EE29B|nr:ABC transporter ATP-binding protein [Pirellula sp. SH-Sr6A]AMV31373.1 Lipid A export ATP-binding/permease protein MsbA [Pirellula sp. SH-Sr6A]